MKGIAVSDLRKRVKRDSPDLRDSQISQVIECWVIESRRTSRITLVAVWNKDGITVDPEEDEVPELGEDEKGSDSDL